MTEQQRDDFKRWTDAALYMADANGMADDTVIPTWPSGRPGDEAMEEYPQLTIGAVRGAVAALSHAERREFQTEQDLINFLDGLYETAGPDSSALTGQKWAPAQRAIEGIRSHAEGEAQPAAMVCNDLRQLYVDMTNADLVREADDEVVGHCITASHLNRFAALLETGVVPNEHGKNRFGLDMAYFRNAINRELNRPLADYRPDELARVFARLSCTADPAVMHEPEFGRSVSQVAVPEAKDVEAQADREDALMAQGWNECRATMLDAAPTAPVGGPIGSDDLVRVPRGLLGAACSAIQHDRPADKVLAELRRYTAGDLARSGQQPVSDFDGVNLRGLLCEAAGKLAAVAHRPLFDAEAERIVERCRAAVDTAPYERGIAQAKEPLHEIADALDCFWNPAIEAIQGGQGGEVVGAIAQGLSAVAERLREHELARLSAGKEGQDHG